MLNTRIDDNRTHGNTCAHPYPHTNVHHCSLYKTDIHITCNWLFTACICKLFTLPHLVTTYHVGSTCAYRYPHTKLIKIDHCVPSYVCLFVFYFHFICLFIYLLTYIYATIHTYILTPTNSVWTFQHGWRPTKT